MNLPDARKGRGRITRWFKQVEKKHRRVPLPDFDEVRDKVEKAPSVFEGWQDRVPPRAIGGYNPNESRSERDKRVKREAEACRRAKKKRDAAAADRDDRVAAAKKALAEHEVAIKKCEEVTPPMLDAITILFELGDPACSKLARKAVSRLFDSQSWMRPEIMGAVLRAGTRDALRFYLERLAAEDNKGYRGTTQAEENHGFLADKGGNLIRGNEMMMKRFELINEDRIAARAWPADTRPRLIDLVKRLKLKPLPTLSKAEDEMRERSKGEPAAKRGKGIGLQFDPTYGRNYVGPLYAEWAKANLPQVPEKTGRESQ